MVLDHFTSAQTFESLLLVQLPFHVFVELFLRVGLAVLGEHVHVLEAKSAEGHLVRLSCMLTESGEGGE